MKHMYLFCLLILLLSACGGEELRLSPEAQSSEKAAIMEPLPTTTADLEEGTEENDMITHQTITAEDAQKFMEEWTEYFLLDVRTEEEYLTQRIDHAILIPYEEIADRFETITTDRDAYILIYCRSGRRSAIAAQQLAEMGYKKVYDFGGILDWPFDTIAG